MRRTNKNYNLQFVTQKNHAKIRRPRQARRETMVGKSRLGFINHLVRWYW
jgi:hypothetical protein